MLDHNALVSAMMCYSEQQFIRALRKDPEERGMQVCNGKALLSAEGFGAEITQPLTFP